MTELEKKKFAPVLLVARLAAGGLLFYAGFSKLNQAHAFAQAIANFRLLPAAGNQILAVTLPWLEVLAGALLIFAVWTRATGIVALSLFLVFAGATIAALARGLDIECGCFGTGAGARIGLQSLGIQTAGLVSSAYIIFAAPKSSQ